MNTIVNKVDLTKDLTDHLVDIPQATVKKVMDAVWEVIKNKLAKGEQISIAGFGSFYVKSRAARMGRNPKTGEQIQIEASKSPGFKAGKQLKDAIKKI